MATVTKTIIAGGGGDYTTVQAAEDATNLNSGADIWKMVISDASDYDENILINTDGTSVTSYPWLTVAKKFRHRGVAGTSHGRMYGSGGSHVITMDADFARVSWLDIQQDQTGDSDEGFRISDGSDNNLIQYCIIHASSPTAGNQDGIYIPGSGLTILNLRVDDCVIYNWGRRGIYYQQGNASTAGTFTVDVDHCAIHDVGGGSLPQSIMLEADASGTNATLGLHNTWGTGTGTTSPFADGDSEVATTTPDGAVTWNGSHNAVAVPGDLDDIDGTNNLTNTQLATSGIADVTKSSGAWIVVRELAGGSENLQVLDEAAGNLLAGNGTNRQGSEPDTRQDFSIDITGGARPTTNVTIGAHQFDPNFYAEDNVLVDSATDDLTVLTIPGAWLAANTEYLIVARALTGGSSAGGVYDMWAETADDTSIATKSLQKMEPEQTGTQALAPFFFVHSYETDGTPADVLLKVTSSTGTSRADQMTLFLLDLDAIGESGYWDGTVTDNDGVWTSDSNIADGNLATQGFTSTTGSTSSNEIRIANNQHPTSGNVAEPVTVQFNVRAASSEVVMGFEVFDGGDSLMSGTATVDNVGIVQDWTQPFHVPAPSGGWTAAKMEGLEVVMWMVSGGTLHIGRVDFRTGYVEHAPDHYADTSGTDSGAVGEYSITAATTLLAQLDGAALSTDEYLILGYARADIGSTGRWFNHSLQAADDTSTAAERSFHQAEGEDTNEQRLSGYAIRHKASSGTPDVTLYGTEEAANGNMIDGGAYLIALPTSLFADFEHDYTAATIAVDDVETTIATSGSYTPTVTGNHLIIGRSNGEDTPSALGGMWVESTTTEIRTGDSTPSHNQTWDNGKDEEQQVTFQRYSITTAETFNLRSLSGGFPFDQQHRWLIVVNLNPPAAPAVGAFPPFLRRQRPHVRM